MGWNSCIIGLAVKILILCTIGEPLGNVYEYFCATIHGLFELRLYPILGKMWEVVLAKTLQLR